MPRWHATIKFDFKTDAGDVIIHPGIFEYPVQIKTIIQGFGYPKYKFKSKLIKNNLNDTLTVNYLLETSGYFYEFDVDITVSIDTTTLVIISGENSNGDIFMNNNLFETKFLNYGLKTPKGKIINID